MNTSVETDLCIEYICAVVCKYLYYAVDNTPIYTFFLNLINLVRSGLTFLKKISMNISPTQTFDSIHFHNFFYTYMITQFVIYIEALSLQPIPYKIFTLLALSEWKVIYSLMLSMFPKFGWISNNLLEYFPSYKSCVKHFEYFLKHNRILIAFILIELSLKHYLK